jgi:hypothetical protein
MTIAVCNPNFNGDVLWSVPAARELVHRAHEHADFYLSHRGEACADLLEEQSFVHDVFVARDWDGDFPRDFPRDDYSAVYPLHMRGAQDCTLLDHFCRVAGLPRQEHRLDLPEVWTNHWQSSLPPSPFVVLAAKAGDGSEWMKAINDIFRDFVARCSVPVVEVGHPGVMLNPLGVIDRSSYGFLAMAQIISRCRVFVGTISAPLVIADAFPDVRRIAVHDGEKWNLNNVTKSPMNHYPVYPTGKELADLVEGLL